MREVDEDILLLEWENTLLTKLAKTKNVDSINHSYNQYLQKKQLVCTLFSPLSAISSMYNKQFLKSDIMSAWDYAVQNYWYKQGEWNFAETGVKLSVSDGIQTIIVRKLYTLRHTIEQKKQEQQWWKDTLCSSIGWNQSYNKIDMMVT